MENIFAYTEIDYQPAYYPGYVSLNERNGQAELSVRTRGTADASVLPLTDEELGKLAASIQIYLQSKQG